MNKNLLYDGFIKVSYFSPIKITRENILKGLQNVVSKYAKGKLVDLWCGVKPYESLFKPYIKSYYGVDYPTTSESNYGHNTKADLFVE